MMKYYGCIISVFIFILSSFALGEENKEKAKFYEKKATFFKCKRKDYDKAIEMYRKAIELDPNNFQYHFHLGSTLAWEKKMYNDGIKEFQKALEIDPNNWWVPCVYARLAGAYIELGEYDKAIKEIKNWQESLNSDKYEDSLKTQAYATSYSFLEKIYKKKGDLVQAEEMAKKVEEFKKLIEIARKKFNKKFDEEMDRNIKFRRELMLQEGLVSFVIDMVIMKDLLRIFIPFAVILTLIWLVYIIQRKRTKAIEHPEVKWGIKEIVVSYLSSVILGNIIFISLYLTVAIQQKIICMMGRVMLEILLISFIIYYVKGKYNQSLRCIGLTREKLMRNIWLGLAGGIGTIFLIIGVVTIIFLLASLLGGGVAKFVDEIILPSPSEEMKKWFYSQSQPFHLLFFLCLTVLFPLAEEMFFRGFIYSALRQIIGMQWAMVLSSLFFGLWRQELPIITSFLVGLCFVYLYERTKSLIPCIVAHSFMQAGVLLLTYFFPS